MELSEAILNRRSIRQYKTTPVPREMIEEVIQAAIMAPSWKNSQVSRYYVVDTPEQKNAFLACLPAFNANNVKDAPVIIVSTIVKNRSGYDREGNPDSHLGSGFQYFDNGLQVQNLCLKAYELGLGTLIMGLYDEGKIREFFEVPESEDIVAVIGLGYPDIEAQAPKRKSVDQVVKYKC